MRVKYKKLYLIILPSNTIEANLGISNSDYIGFFTKNDFNHIKSKGAESKAVRIRYGIDANNIGKLGFKERNNIKTKRIFVSAGGF